MAKRIAWAFIAKYQRKEILSYWFKRTGNKAYSRKLSEIIRKRVFYLAKFNYMGKTTDFPETRVTAAGHFSVFY